MGLTWKRRLVLVVVCMLMIVVAPSPAPAVLASWCDGTFTESASCSFVYAGHSLAVYGEAYATSAPSLYVRIIEPNTETVLASCYAHGSGTRVFCDSSSGNVLKPFAPIPAGVILQCVVTGETTGTFGCLSKVI